MERLLFVDDDLEILEINRKYFETCGYHVNTATDALTALSCLSEHTYQCVILDIHMEKTDGFCLCRTIRANYSIPVIFLTTLTDEEIMIESFDCGGDDYITKPFDLDETLARIESNLRRSKLQTFPKKVLKFQELTLDTGSLTAYLKGVELSLTAKEFRILELLMRYPDKIFSKANLFQSIWGSEYLSEDNTLNVHISHLRNKLKAVSSENEYIDTVWGIGYRLHKD